MTYGHPRVGRAGGGGEGVTDGAGKGLYYE